MSGIEIERKFIVTPKSNYKAQAFARFRVQQAYMPCLTGTVRIRTKGEQAFLTIKGKSADNGLSRYEFEKEITQDEAQALFKLCVGGKIDKTRYLVKSGPHTFEIDEFYGDNEGLVMAEVELKNTHELFKKPSFIGKEVTGDHRFYNTQLLTNPYKNWKEDFSNEP